MESVGTSRRWLKVAAFIALALVACSGQDRVTLNERLFVQDGSHLTYEGGGCMWMELGGPRASTGFHDSDFAVSEGTDGDVLLVQVFSGNDVLATRRYDKAMLDSGRVDEFTVTTHEQKHHVLRYWGGTCSPLDAGTDGGSWVDAAVQR